MSLTSTLLLLLLLAPVCWVIGESIVAHGNARIERDSEERRKQEKEKLYFDLMEPWEWSESSKRLSPQEVLHRQRLAARAREQKFLKGQEAERRRAELSPTDNYER